MRKRLLVGALLTALLLPSPTFAAPGEFRVAGSVSRDPSGVKGELVPVHVPWDGVNARSEILSCLTGPYSIANRVLMIQKPTSTVKIQLQGDTDSSWSLVEASGACAGLSGSGAFRLTETPLFRLDGNLDLPAPGAADELEPDPAEEPDPASADSPAPKP